MFVIPLQNLASSGDLAAGLLAQLRAGNSLRGRVVAGGPQGSAVQVGGARLALPEPLPQGASVMVRLLSGGQGERLEVRVQGQPAPAPQPAVPGGEPSPQVLLAARALHLAGLPTREGLPGQLASLMGGLTAEQVPLLALALARQWPFSEPILAALTRLFRQRADLGLSLTDLGAALARDATPAHPELWREAREALARHLGQWERLGGGARQALHDVQREGGGMLETLLARWTRGEVSDWREIHDLRLLLLRLRAVAGQAGRTPLLPLIDKALDAMEQHRLAADNSDPNERRWFLQLPVSQQGQPSTVELLIRQQRGNQQDQANERPYEAVLTLRLANLGGVRVELRYHERVASLTFRVEQPETQTRVLEQQETLRQGLEAAGIRLARFHCMVQDRIEPLTWPEIFPDLARPSGLHGGHGVDTTM